LATATPANNAAFSDTDRSMTPVARRLMATGSGPAPSRARPGTRDRRRPVASTRPRGNRDRPHPRHTAQRQGHRPVLGATPQVGKPKFHFTDDEPNPQVRTETSPEDPMTATTREAGRSAALDDSTWVLRTRDSAPIADYERWTSLPRPTHSARRMSSSVRPSGPPVSDG
jgi:hypothetical protein